MALDFWKIIYIRSKHPMPHYVDASKHPHMTLCPVVFDFKNGINNTPTSRSVFSIYLNRRYHESTGIGNGHATMNKLRSKRAQNNPGPWMLNTLHPNQVMLCAAMERGIPVYNALGEASRPLLDRHLDCLSSSRKKDGVFRLTK